MIAKLGTPLQLGSQLFYELLLQLYDGLLLL